MNIFNFKPYIDSVRISRPGKRRFLLLLVAGIVILLFARWLLTETFALPTPQMHAVRALSDTTEVLFIGTSHAQYGVNPSVFKRPTVVLSAAFLDYVNMERIWQVHKGKIPSLKLVVLEIGAGSMYLNRMEATFSPQELIDLDVYKAVPWYVQAADFDGLVRRFLRPLLVWRFSPKTWLEHENTDHSIELQGANWPGFMVTYDKSDESQVRQIAKDKIQWIDEHTSDEVLAQNRAAFRRLLEDLRGKGIKVALLQYPLHPEALSSISDIWLAEVQTMLDLAREILGHETHIYNYLNFDQLESDDFRDADHLNLDGAKKLSTELSRNLVQEILND